LFGVEDSTADAMWYLAKVEVAFLLVAFCDFMIVGNDYKVFGT
jgi:hypothetical protein